MIPENLRTRVEFGTGKIALLDREVGSDTVIFYSRSALADVSRRWPQAQSSVVSGEPSTETVNESLAALPPSIRHVVGIGGGSALDTAKAVAAALELGERDCNALLDRNVADFRQKIRLTLLPSTSGTGSELSRGSIIFDPAKSLKRGIRGNIVLADTAIVDPALTVSCSPEVTAATGFDCLAHATETYLSRKSTPETRKISIQILRDVLDFLPVAYRDGRDLGAREALSRASLYAGYNLSETSTCLPHRIQYTFPEEWGLSHGLGLALIYPDWLKVVHAATPERSRLENELGRGDFLDLVLRLQETTGIRRTLSQRMKGARFDIRPESVVGNLQDDPGYSPEKLAELMQRLKESVERGI